MIFTSKRHHLLRLLLLLQPSVRADKWSQTQVPVLLTAECYSVSVFQYYSVTLLHLCSKNELYSCVTVTTGPRVTASASTFTTLTCISSKTCTWDVGEHLCGTKQETNSKLEARVVCSPAELLCFGIIGDSGFKKPKFSDAAQRKSESELTTNHVWYSLICIYLLLLLLCLLFHYSYCISYTSVGQHCGQPRVFLKSCRNKLWWGYLPVAQYKQDSL